MKMLRFDKCEMGKTKVDHNGYLNTDAVITRTGVFVYHHPDGSTTRELRHPDEVFKSDSMKSLENRPVTFRHPPQGEVNSKNTRYLSVGSVYGDINKVDDRLLTTNIMITDQDTIDKVMHESNPIREISAGYHADVVPQVGTYKGEHYDHVQKNIVYNHVAIVQRGRAGREARLNLDALEEGQSYAIQDLLGLQPQQISNLQSKEVKSMKFKTVKGAVKTDSFEAAPITLVVDSEDEATVENAVNVLSARADSAVEHIVVLEGKLAESTGEVEKLQGRIDEMQKDVKKEISPEELTSLVKDRTDALAVAAHVGIKVDGIESMTTKEIKKAIVMDSCDLPEDAPETYINGRYDTIYDRAKSETENFASVMKLKGASHTDGDDNNDDDKTVDRRDSLADEIGEMWRDKPADA